MFQTWGENLDFASGVIAVNKNYTKKIYIWKNKKKIKEKGKILNLFLLVFASCQIKNFLLF